MFTCMDNSSNNRRFDPADDNRLLSNWLTGPGRTTLVVVAAGVVIWGIAVLVMSL